MEAAMAKTLVCNRCGKDVPAESFRIVTACPHCGGALACEVALGMSGAARAASWVWHWLRLIAGLAVAVFGTWLACALIWHRTSLMPFPCRTHPGAAMTFAAALALGGAFVAGREWVRLRKLRSVAAGDAGADAKER